MSGELTSFIVGGVTVIIIGREVIIIIEPNIIIIVIGLIIVPVIGQGEWRQLIERWFRGSDFISLQVIFFLCSFFFLEISL